jgi:polar amino acid transport system permease protein
VHRARHLPDRRAEGLAQVSTHVRSNAERNVENVSSAAGPGQPRPSTPLLLGRRHLLRWLSGIVALLLAIYGIYLLASNKALDLPVVEHYFTSSVILQGLGLTLWLTALVTVLALAGGVVIATMRLAPNPVLQALSWVYVWFFRSVPLLVQLLFWYNIAYLFPRFSLGIPFGPTFVSTPSEALISATTAAVVGLTLHEAAYAAEIIRGGILAVDAGQSEAATALGLSRTRILRRIVLPQAMRSIVPAAGNLLIGTLKGTAIVSVIAVDDLLYSAQFVYNRTYQVMPLLFVATLWYLLVTSVLSCLQYYVERHFAKGAHRALPPTPLQRARSACISLAARIGTRARGDAQ